MYLRYHQKNNFGDALNPLIWDHFLPGFFDDDRSTVFVGIGSLLGFDFEPTSRKIVFSTGLGGGDPANYGRAPTLDPSWEIVCVRGPLTAETLGIPSGKAVTDGAALIRRMAWPEPEPRYTCSLMPHVRSLEFLDFETLCLDNGLHFIDPRRDPSVIVGEIMASGKLVAEALHGAIAADALRVPWVPLKMFRQVNEFKWRDWAASMEVEGMETGRPPELFDRDALSRIAAHKLGRLDISPLREALAGGYALFQDRVVRPRVDSALAILRERQGYLSAERVLDARCDRLLELLSDVRRRWGS